MARPHIVIFNPDQWRGDVLGHAGNPAAVTPNLDRLVASDAVSFERAFCQNPVCTPSRCSFMSGWYPHVRGHRTMHHMMRPGEPVLLKTLKDNGYFVWWGGKNDLVPTQNGFDAYCDVKYEPEEELRPMFANDRQAEWRGEPGSDGYYSFYVGQLPTEGDEPYYDRDWANVRGAIDRIRQWGEEDHADDDALCLYLPLTYPHPPYAVEDPWFSLIDHDLLPDRPTGPGSRVGRRAEHPHRDPYPTRAAWLVRGTVAGAASHLLRDVRPGRSPARPGAAGPPRRRDVRRHRSVLLLRSW